MTDPGGAIGAASATGGVDQGCSLSDGLAERFEAGIAEGKNQAQAEFADQLAQQEALLSEQFNQQLAILQGDLGERLTVAIKTELHNIEVTIANALAAVIRPFVSGAVEIRVLDELTTAINDILSDPQSSQMTVRGPKALLNVLEDKLNNTSAAIIFVESDDPEICVEHGREKIESRLTDWSNLIKSELR